MPDRQTGCVIGVTGQIGAGKSTVGALLARRGFRHVELDEIGHEVLRRPEIREAVLDAFGAAVADVHGEINRRELGRIVFADPAARTQLNAVLHPPMIVELERRVREELAQGKAGVVINAALLYAMGLDRLCHRIIYVRANAETRLQRIIAQRGLSSERARARLTSQDQEPAGDPRVLFCDNDGPIEALTQWVEHTLGTISRASAGAGPVHGPF